MINEIKCSWFIPTNSEVKVPGVLTIDDEKNYYLLTLYSNKYIDEFSKSNVIWGETPFEKITLFDILSLKSNGFNYLCITEILPNFIVISKQHYNHIDDIKINNLTLKISYLDDWLLANQQQHFNIQDEGVSFNIKYLNDNNFNVQIDESCVLKFENYCFPQYENSKKIILEVFCLATFELKEIQSLSNLLNLTVKLQNLLTLFVGKPVSILQRSSVDYLTNFPIRIYIGNSNSGKINKPIHFSDLLISFKSFSNDDISNFVIKWFNQYDNLEPVFDIFFHSIAPFWGKDNLVITNVEYNNSFLNLIQAIESYHRRKFPDENKVIKELNTKRETLLSKLTCLSIDDKNWIINNLKVCKKTELTLNERIVSLISDEIFLEIFENAKNKAKQLVKFRVTLTHVNHDKSHELFIPKNIFDDVQIILLVNFYLLIGLNKTSIMDILGKKFPLNTN